MRRGAGVLLMVVLAAGNPAAANESEDVGPSLQAIDKLRDAGDMEGAARQAGDLVAKHPEDLRAHLAFQDLELALGRERQVLETYRSAARAADATADQHYLCARLLRGTQAIAEFRAALKADPKHFWALCGLGVELTQARQWPEAERVLKEARDLRPLSAVPVNALGRVEEARGRNGDAEKLYRAAIDLAPAMTIARVNLGVLLVGMGKQEDAIKVLQDAASAAPKDPMPLLGLGMAYMSLKAAEKAAAQYQKAVELDAGGVTSLNLLANAYISLDQMELAEQALQKALAKAPDSVATQVNLAYLRIQSGRLDDAVKIASRALQLDDSCAQAHYLLGLAFDHQAIPKKAETEFHKAEKLDPENPVFVRAVIALAESQGDWKTAIAECTQLVKMTQAAGDALMELARAYTGGEKPKNAAQTYDSVVAAEPNRLDAWLDLGIVCQRDLRDLKRAARAFKEYVARGGADPRVPKWLAAIEEK